LKDFNLKEKTAFAEDGKTMIIVEEKIDGANLGISLTDACQN